MSPTIIHGSHSATSWEGGWHGPRGSSIFGEFGGDSGSQPISFLVETIISKFPTMVIETAVMSESPTPKCKTVDEVDSGDVACDPPSICKIGPVAHHRLAHLLLPLNWTLE
ncbi:hypothetical protein Salat_1150300 [Sesamum alatum]|uniref:Uncharacterized protein n=1 Tax=Sesamum alatum TaxID=300844 RepID=A0AAE2CNC2_9LAMI|nr:hypothetical protein Salat_1150300 [Sesamum alatum]